jgi:molybdenum cofactor synthesis domain-containing protein
MIRAAVLTVSDSASAGKRQDVSGPELRRRCERLGWTVVFEDVVSDDAALIAAKLSDWTDAGEVELILTTGGTGIAKRDVTPEATRAVLERELPGFGEVMRSEGRKITRFAALSRATAGTRGRTLIVNVPGSPKGAVESFEAVADLIPHTLDLLRGQTSH